MPRSAADAIAPVLPERTLAGAKRERFEEVFRRDSRAVLAYALRRTDRPEDAADVVSEVMLTAWRRVDDLPPGPEARLWLYGVARRVLANQRRSSRRRARLGERLRSVVASEIGEDLAEAHVRQAELRDALKALPEADREVLLLTAWEGLEASEVAVVMSLSPTAVRTRMHRGRARLREALAGRAPTTESEEGP